jgi:hypothetical protein
LSSTTERSQEQGQILVLFAGAAVALMIVAALAFDVGSMYLERRDQQNAADAAALAGARYVNGAADFHGTCAGATGDAVLAACRVVDVNGFQDAAGDEDVLVDIPPVTGIYAGFDHSVQVRINSRRGSIFGGIVGRSVWPVGVSAVAANEDEVEYPFGMLALSPTDCKAIQISGTGVVDSASNVQSNSNGSGCADGSNIGFSRSGAGVLNVSADGVCRSGGELQDQGSGTMTCVVEEFSFALPDPLAGLAAPTKPTTPTPTMKEWVGATKVDAPTNIPDYCPGAVAPKDPQEATPRLCVLGQGGSQANRKWILSPGLYPGGLELKGGVTAYLLPGIYWIGGGGFQASNDVTIISVDDETDTTKAVCTLGATPPCTGGGGVLIYNSKLVNAAAGPITMGGGGATLSLMPYDYPFGVATIDLVIFQDRTVNLVTKLNGSDSQASDVRGIVYNPLGEVQVNGANSMFTMDQVIAYTFKINGSGGTVRVLRETGVDALITAIGLVE